LSGTVRDLHTYETEFAASLHQLQTIKNATNKKVASSTEDDDNVYPYRLDMKYCHLRQDLPVHSQLFDRLVVKQTKSVINLFDGIERCSTLKSSKKSSGRTRRRKKRWSCEGDVSHASTCNGEEKGDKQHGLELYAGLDGSSLHQAVMKEPLRPSRHLDANEWNQTLDGIKSSHGALIIDVRNVYESRVGHFLHPTTPTLLTNTRKYSDLVSLLASSPHLNDDKRKQVFMYCT
jgi:hypothetical protein